MRRHAAAFALLGAALIGGAQQATTASNAVPNDSTAVYRATTVNNARLVSISYTVTAGNITAMTPRLRRIALPLTVTARFGTGPTITCTRGLLSVLNVLTGLGEATYTCTGILESASRPRPLVITAS